MTVLILRTLAAIDFDRDFQATFCFSLFGLTFSLALLRLFDVDFGALLSHAG